MPADVTPQVTEALAEAVFAEPGAAVYEAYSDIDAEPAHIQSAQDFTLYVSARLRAPKGAAHFVVHYPEMKGALHKHLVALDERAYPGGHIRYTWKGWGLIWVFLSGPQNGSFVAANSERRALKWLHTDPQIVHPSAWDWRAVGRHQRRLRRVLLKELEKSGSSSVVPAA